LRIGPVDDDNSAGKEPTSNAVTVDMPYCRDKDSSETKSKLKRAALLPRSLQRDIDKYVALRCKMNAQTNKQNNVERVNRTLYQFFTVTINASDKSETAKIKSGAVHATKVIRCICFSQRL